MADQDKDENETTIANDQVVSKYKMVGEIVNRVAKKLIGKCVAGESVLNLCETGDSDLTAETDKVFKAKKDLRKGVAFPTCVSVNNCICHYSPLKSGTDYLLKDGDVVKLDLGAHIDGYIGVVAHTVIVGATKDNKVSGRNADVILAAYYAAEAALRLVRPTGENYAVTDSISKVADVYNCKAISGMLSHQLKQFRIDGEKSIIQNPTEAQRKEHEKCEFGVHEVYAIDVLISTGEGKGKETDSRTTVYKKTEQVYQLKMKASRAFLAEVDKNFGPMPFTLRSLPDENKARMGVVECVNHKLLEAFNVLYEKDDAVVAQFKYTVLLMPSGTHQITGLPLDLELYNSEHKIDDETLLNLLAQPLKPEKKKKSPAAKVSGDTPAPEA